MSFTEEEGQHVLPDGVKLYTKTWRVCNAYYTLFPTLCAHKILVHTFDQRGWGRSAPTLASQGNIGTTPQILSDINSFIQSHLPSPLPLFLMGHSMGGQLALHFFAHGPPQTISALGGLLCESPHIAFPPAAEPPWLKVLLGKLAARLFPKRKLKSKLSPKDMSRDENVVREFERDPWNYDAVSLEGLAGLLDRAARLDRGDVVVGTGVSLWIGHGSGDRVTSVEASRRFVERGVKRGARDWTLREFEGWFHKLHAEPNNDKITFANEVAMWVLDRSRDRSSTGGESGESKGAREERESEGGRNVKARESKIREEEREEEGGNGTGGEEGKRKRKDTPVAKL
ncbi:MAG: hypothetical protein M1834_000542 [Cirrosporium novae-zelandiae]|nr:MAG: hypothetical protein M1834_000542 [Cirrosporium novae-zelandiae]